VLDLAFPGFLKTNESRLIPMTLAQTILERLKEHLALPWPENVSPANAS
jgi:hypothetical protein